MSENGNAKLTFEVVSGEELAKFAFDQKVEESGLRVLRHRLYPLVAVITALLSTFGIGLTWWVNKVAQRAETLNTSIATAQKDLQALNDDIATVRAAARELRLKRDEIDVEMTAMARRSQLVETQSVSAIATAAAAQTTGTTARDMAIRAQDELNALLRDISSRTADLDKRFDTVKNNADGAARDRAVIQDIRADAEDFATAVKEHRQLIAATVADSLTLRANDFAEIVLPRLQDKGTFKIRFDTGSIHRRKVFDITYSINGGRRHVVKVSPDDIRRQIPMEDTNGEYQFMLEIIFSGVVVRDFITFRISAISSNVGGTVQTTQMP